MAKLTGLQRFQIAKVWLQRGRLEEKEEFIKKVCEAKGIEYIPPVKINRAL